MMTKGDRRSKNKFLIFLLLAAAFVLIRLLFMFSSERFISHGEEFMTGSIAKGIIQGWASPLIDFQVRSYHGGPILDALVAVPFFAVFGPSIFSLKLAGLFIHLAGFLLFLVFLSRYFGARAAVFSALLYVFAPPIFLAWNLIPVGSHPETAFFSALTLLLLFNALFRTPSSAAFFFLGLASGLSIWYSYSNLPLFLFCTAVLLFNFAQERIRKNYPVFAGALVIGLLPLIVFNLRNANRGLELLNYNAGHLHRAWNIPVLFKDGATFLFTDLPEIFCFQDFALSSGALCNMIYYAVFLCSFVYLAVRMFAARQSVSSAAAGTTGLTAQRAGIILLYPVLFAAVYLFSAHRFEHTGSALNDYRYSLMLYPFIFAIIGIALSWLASSRKFFLRLSGYSTVFLLVLVSLWGSGRFLASLDFKNKYLEMEASDCSEIGGRMFRLYGRDVGRAVARLSRIRDPGDREAAYIGYGKEIGSSFGSGVKMDLLDILDREIGSLYLRKLCFFGIGRGLGGYLNYSLRPEDGLKKAAGEFDNPAIPYVLRNYIFCGLFEALIVMKPQWYPLQVLLRCCPPRYRQFLYTVYFLDSWRGKDPALVHPDLTGVPEEFSGYAYSGVGAGIALFFSGDADKTVRFIREHYPGEAGKLMAGVGEFLYHLSNFNRERAERLISASWQPFRSQIIEGMERLDRFLNAEDGSSGRPGL